MLLIIVVTVCCLAYANGANDNFKGVSTLFGSGTTDYRRALAWATATTLLGSLTAVLLADKLLKSFSGKGLVDASLAGAAGYGAAVAMGAGLTVLLATRLGMPVSTTHGLVGALLGAGWAAGSAINFERLAGGFFLPLMVSPLLSIAATVVLYPALSWLRRRSGVTSETCLCLGAETLEAAPAAGGAAVLRRAEELSAKLGDTVSCQSRYQGAVLGIDAATLVDRLHYLSAGMVCFARGLNDTPKIAALLLLAPALGKLGSTALVGVMIALGGVLSARRVAETVSQKITAMNHGQGFTANLMTGLIVIGASRMGLPVSTTHVSCGSLFGIGMITRQGHWSTIGKITGAWVVTLPLGSALGALCFKAIAAF